MSTLPNFTPAALADGEIADWRWLTPPRFAAIALLTSLLGLSTIWPTARFFWHLWTTDALQSIGMAVPLASLILILRAWRSLGWRADANWWGLVVLVATAAAVRLGEHAIVLLTLSPEYAIVLPPPRIALVAYATGVVLLMGGNSLFRAAVFPIALLWFASPVPHLFSSWIDLPLQQASATVAHAFATRLGQPLNPDHLRLMFTPEFGMFIAPGCNGIRGAVTMGLIALIAGHVYRFRGYTSAAVVAGAVLLGYLFNLLRLCLLVLYYLVALHIPALQGKAETADYIIGAVLFLLATVLLFEAITRLRSSRGPLDAVLSDTLTPRSSSLQYAPLAALAVLALIGWVGLARASAAPSPAALSDPSLRRFPAQLGGYRLLKTWDETELTGTLVYAWARYAPQQGGTPISIGLAPANGWHNPIYCHAARGERPLWQGQLTATTEQGAATDLTSAYYDNGFTRRLESSTLCSGLSCGQVTTANRGIGLIYSRPDAGSLLSRTSQATSPVLIRVESADRTRTPEMERQALARATLSFLASVNLSDLTRPYRR